VNRTISLPERLLRGGGEFLTKLIYRVAVHGQEKLPTGGFLLLPNHLSYIDAVVLQIACPRPIRFIVHDEIYKLRLLNPIFRAIGALPISAKRSKETLRAAAELIEQGEIVCVFPEGELSRTGMLLRLRRGYELIARTAKCPVVPVWLDQLWGSVFSFAGGKFFSNGHARCRIASASHSVNRSRMSRRISPPSASTFSSWGNSATSSGRCSAAISDAACVRGLKRRQFDDAVIDGMDHSKLSRGSLLAAAITLSRWIRSECPDRRVAPSCCRRAKAGCS
jgi:acyl-[acyl-carrier-protein]-phospholipid O-acyltransferase/long-chain-fatty-acid--[acyl-carrier-protein] ligase